MAGTSTNAYAELRSRRLTTLVSRSESDVIARRAGAAKLSVSAYLRALALGAPADGRDDAALRQIDALIDRMEGDLASATQEVSAALARMGAA